MEEEEDSDDDDDDDGDDDAAIDDYLSAIYCENRLRICKRNAAHCVPASKLLSFMFSIASLMTLILASCKGTRILLCIPNYRGLWL
jgi:hypothetical protein